MTDFAAIMTGEPAAAPKPRTSGTLSLPNKAPRLDPERALVMTVFGEAPANATPEERQYIAATIANRSKISGKDYTDIVQEGGGSQYNPWGDAKARARMEAITPEQYAAIRADVADVIAGKDDKGGVTHFYHPTTQAKVNGAPPKWDDGTGKKVGEGLFFVGDYGGSKGGGPNFAELVAGGDNTEADDAAFAEAFGGGSVRNTAAPNPASAKPAETSTFFAALTPEQQEAYGTLDKANGGGFDHKAPAGSIKNPRWATKDNPESGTPAGEYFVSLTGELKRMPGGEEVEGGFGKGLARGAADVAQSLAEILPGTEDSELRSRLTADQMRYDADLKGDTKSGLGRFTGQLAATAVPGAGAAKVGGMIAKSAGPIGAFLAGNAGGAGLGGRLLGLGSKAAAGAAEGATAATLVSSASDEPLVDQMKTGAFLGGAARPVIGAMGGLRKFLGSKGLNPAEIAEAARIAAANGALPEKVPLTVGQITGSPVRQMEESALRKGVKGSAAADIMKDAEGEATDAILSNAEKIGAKIAGAPVVRGQSGEAISDALNAKRDAMKKGVGEAYDKARDLGDAAMLGDPVSARTAMLDSLKGFDLDDIPSVARKVESFGERGAPTARDIFDMRAKLSSLTGGQPSPESTAARTAIKALDAHIDDAMTKDLLLGDPEAVKAWRTAIGKNREMMKVFGSDDLVGKLTKREERGGEMVRTIDPAEAANYIFGRASLGTPARAGLTRDLKRLRTVLGTDSPEWNALRGEMFERFVSPARKAGDVEGPTFSGQNFRTAWEKAKVENGPMLQTMFTPDERALIDDFAEIAQRATTKVKGGDNPSGSGFVFQGQVQKALDSLGTMLGSGGGALVGSAVGGPAGMAAGAATGGAIGKGLDMFFKDIKAIKAATKAVSGDVSKAIPKPAITSRLLSGAVVPAGVVSASSVNNRLAVPAPVN